VLNPPSFPPICELTIDACQLFSVQEVVEAGLSAWLDATPAQYVPGMYTLSVLSALPASFMRRGVLDLLLPPKLLLSGEVQGACKLAVRCHHGIDSCLCQTALAIIVGLSRISRKDCLRCNPR
jgi:hypothetical protein